MTATSPQGAVAYSYVASFDGNMNETSRTDGRTDGSGLYTTYASQKIYSDPNNPYRPSTVYDGNGSTGVPSGTGPFVTQGRSAPVAVGSSTYVMTPTWQILLNGTAVATGAGPNGWSVSYNSSASTFTVGAPVSATAGSGYQVQYNTSGGGGSGYSYGSTGTFSVLTGGTKPPARLSWDSHGNLVSMTSPRGTTTTYTYDYSQFALGELTQVQEGSKSPTSYAYFEPSGLAQSVTAPLPGTTSGSQTAVTSYSYDSLGNLLTVTAPGNNAAAAVTTTLGYTSDGSYSHPAAIGQPLTVTNNLGKTAHMRYDAQGNVVAMRDPLSNETDQTYDIRNAPLQTILPATGQTGSGHSGSQIGYLYAEPVTFATAQWPAASLQYGPAATTTQYDEGNAGAVRQVVCTYGSEGETLSVSGSMEPVTYAYDAFYRMTKLADGAGHTTSYFYNPAGYLYQTVYPGAQATPPTAPLTLGTADTITYPSYDADGNLLARVDGNNVTTTYAYNDPESRLTDITYPAGTLSAVHYTYDAYGRHNALTDGTGSQTYTYDDDSGLTSKTVTYTGLPSQTLTYAQWPNGSRRAMTTSLGNFNYNYDAAGHMTSLTNPYNETSRWAYQDNGWLQTQTLGNGATTTYTRNVLGQITRLLNQTATGATLSDFGGASGMSYDGAGNRLTMPVSVPGTPSLSGTTTYAYDYGQMASPTALRGQLTRETSTRAGGYADTYGYDGTAQSPGGTTSGPGNPTTLSAYSFSFNADNQNTAYSYDGNGNQNNPNSPNRYDPENRLTSVYGGSLTFASDADGHQAWEQSGNYRGYTVYDGEQPVLSLDAGGNVVSATTFGPNGLLSVSTYGNGVFYTFDPSGNTSQRLNAGGGVDYSHLTSGYGVQRVHDGMSEQYDGFGAQWGYRNINSGLLFLLGHRYYNSAYGGQFLTRDPMGYAGGLNLYAYTRNNPIARNDASGYQDQNCEDNPDACVGNGSGSGEQPTTGSNPENPGSGSGTPRSEDPGPMGGGAPSTGGGFSPGAGGMPQAPITFGGDSSGSDSGIIYRSGPDTDNNLSPRPGDNGLLSCMDSLSNPIDTVNGGPLNGRPVFPPGGKYCPIDPDQLPPGSVQYDGGTDGNPPGHVSVGPDLPPGVVRGAMPGPPGKLSK